MKFLINGLLFFTLCGSIFNGVRNDVIDSYIMAIKVIVALILLGLWFLIFFKQKKSLFQVAVISLAAGLLLIGDVYNHKFGSFVISLISLYSLSFLVFVYLRYDVHKAVRRIYLFSILILACGFLFLLFDNSLWSFKPSDSSLRIAGFYGSPIPWGYTNATLTIIGIYLFTQKKSLIYLITVPTTFLFMVSSGTRGAFLLLAVYLGSAWLRKLGRFWQIGLLLGGLTAALLGLDSLLVFFGRDVGGLLSGREEIWLGILEVSNIQLLGGNGFMESGFELAQSGYTGPGFRGVGKSISVHNSLLGILFDLGVIFLVAIVALFVQLIRKSRHMNSIFIPYFSGIIVILMFESILFNPFFFPITIFYILAYCVFNEPLNETLRRT